MPTSQFWTAEERIPISQKKVSVQAENGLSYSLGQQINFVIPSTVGYMMPSETYLRMDVRVQGTENVPIGLDGDLGANVLIRDIRISSGGAQNQILEEIQNVNVLSALKYDYETNDNLKQKRALTEGTVLKSNKSRPNNDGTDTNMNNLTTNPYFYTSTGDLTDDSYRTVKCLLKLPTGIFQNDKIFPLAMTQGLRIEIILENSNRVFSQLETSLKNKRVTSNAVFHSINGSNASRAQWTSGANASFVFLERQNGIISVESCPFKVGDQIAFVHPSVDSVTAPGDSRISASAGGVFPGPSASTTKVKITAVTYDTSANIGGSSAATGLVRLNFAEQKNEWTTDITGTVNPLPAGKPTNQFFVYSCGVDEAASFAPTCSVDNVELQVQQVEMPAGYISKMNSMLKAGGAMNYDFLSFTNYKYSQLQSDRVVNIRLPIQNSRCKSILAIPTDATPYTAKQSVSAETTYQVNNLTRDTGGGAYSYNNSTRSGLVGIADHASNYQFIYNGKLNPNRKVPLNRISVNGELLALNQQSIIENEKALRMADIDPLSFDKFQENFFIGRSLSLASGVYDARGKDFNLQVEYQETIGPTKPKLWNCFVGHLRRIVVKGDSIALEV
tara:strand:+ start:882 stop:2729 length:1848 start_codon:yes stop_codon:yes gene_type:complete